MASRAMPTLQLLISGFLALFAVVSGRFLASCKDLDWQDADGDTCSDYAREKWCGAKWAQKYSTPGIVGKESTAAQACCSCGGGRRRGDSDLDAEVTASSFHDSSRDEETSSATFQDETEVAAQKAKDSERLAREAEARGREAALRQQKTMQEEGARRAAQIEAEQAETDGREAEAREQRAQSEVAAKKNAVEHDAKDIQEKEVAERKELEEQLAAAKAVAAHEDAQQVKTEEANAEKIQLAVAEQAKAEQAKRQAAKDAEMVNAKEVEEAARRTLEEKAARQVAELNAESAERRGKEAESERDQEKRMRLDLQVQVSAQMRRADELVDEVARAQGEESSLRNATRAANEAQDIAENAISDAKRRNEELLFANRQLHARYERAEQADAIDRRIAATAQTAYGNISNQLGLATNRIQTAEAEREDQRKEKEELTGIAHSAQDEAASAKNAATNATNTLNRVSNDLAMAKKQIESLEYDRVQGLAANEAANRQAAKALRAQNSTEEHVGALRKLLVKTEEKLHDSEVRRKAAVEAAMEAERHHGTRKRKKTKD